MIPLVKISPEGIIVNNQVRKIKIKSDNWLKDIYLEIGLEYSKFFRMDDLSKISILGIEIIKKSFNINYYNNDDISIIFSNTSASTNVDNKFWSSYKNSIPSPSLFVYTLPNICIGEIAIFNKWYGGSCFFISDSINDVPIEDLINVEFSKGVNACIFGWVENEIGIFFLVEKHVKSIELKKVIKMAKQN